MIPVDELLTSWLAANLPGVGVSSKRPSDLEKTLPRVVLRRTGGGGVWVDNPVVAVDSYAAPPAGDEISPSAVLAGRVHDLFRLATPAGWKGRQFTLRQVNQAPFEVSDANQAVEHYTAIYTFSLQ